MALESIQNPATYFGREVRPTYYHWHVGQVIAQFDKDAKEQKAQLRDFAMTVKPLTDPSDRAYALARVIQGASAAGDDTTYKSALSMLYKCQTKTCPFGTGIVGYNVKASLNTLEALWPAKPTDDDREAMNSMIDAWLAARRRLNRIGILVALARERDACKAYFEHDEAIVRAKDEDVLEVDHRDYLVVIITGKALVDGAEATASLTDKHRVTRVIIVGVARSLGQAVGDGTFRGPEQGDVVIATSTAAYSLREKLRETVEDAPVPCGQVTWTVLPTDTTLFMLGHRVQKERLPLKVYEGLIVTGNGIKDNPADKFKLLHEWPGGLAVSEEGFAAALECVLHGVPTLRSVEFPAWQRVTENRRMRTLTRKRRTRCWQLNTQRGSLFG